MKKNTHIIEKVFLEIDTNSIKVAHSLKNNVNMFIENELLQLIEKELDRFSLKENEVLQIEKLTISLHSDNLKSDNSLSLSFNENFSSLSLNNGFFKREIENQIRQKIEAIIQQSKTNSNNNQELTQNGYSENLSITLQEKKSNTLLHYLVYGELPWWSVSETQINTQQDNIFKKENSNIFNIDNIIEIINAKNFKSKLKTIIEKSIVRQRLIKQFPNEQLALIASSFESIIVENHKEVIQKNKLILFLNKTNDFEIKKYFWETIFNYLNDNNPKKTVFFYYKNKDLFEKSKWSFEAFITLIKEFIPFNHQINNLLNILKEQHLSKEDTKTTISKKESIKKQSESDDSIKEQDIVIDNQVKKAFYIQNAGLILIHPFIKEFFKSCELITKENTIKDKEMAVHLLHYVATKKEYDYEYNMLFEKFLCGLPLHYPIKREISVPEAYIAEAEGMLTSAVSHWNVLKSTSTDLLRNEFLQREGKLDIQDSNPKIHIVRKTQDILLDRLPWNISIVKIPWIEKLIYTEW